MEKFEYTLKRRIEDKIIDAIVFGIGLVCRIVEKSKQPKPLNKKNMVSLPDVKPGEKLVTIFKCYDDDDLVKAYDDELVAIRWMYTQRARNPKDFVIYHRVPVVVPVGIDMDEYLAHLVEVE